MSKHLVSWCAGCAPTLLFLMSTSDACAQAYAQFDVGDDIQVSGPALLFEGPALPPTPAVDELTAAELQSAQPEAVPAPPPSSNPSNLASPLNGSPQDGRPRRNSQPRPTPDAATSSPATSSTGDPFASLSALTETQPSFNPADRAPQMFGDFLANGAIMAGTGTGDVLKAELPLVQRSKIADNNSPMPACRCYLAHHHFHNAIEFQRIDPTTGRTALADDYSIDRYILGYERKMFDGCWSIEIRMPLDTKFSLVRGTPTDFTMSDGQYGDLMVIFKRLLYNCDGLVLSAGAGLSIPTGSDVHGTLPEDDTQFTIRNGSYRVQPFLGFIYVPPSCHGIFYQGFAALDADLTGNDIEVTDASTGTTQRSLGNVTEQSLLYLDFAAGWWVYHNPHSNWLNAAAFVLESHYVTTVEDAEIFRAATNTAPMFGNFINRFDVINLTAGVHTEVGCNTNVRFGVALPMRDARDERFFDAELLFAINKRF